jgi:hypothetical protein
MGSTHHILPQWHRLHWLAGPRSASGTNIAKLSVETSSKKRVSCNGLQWQREGAGKRKAIPNTLEVGFLDSVIVYLDVLEAKNDQGKLFNSYRLI